MMPTLLGLAGVETYVDGGSPACLLACVQLGAFAVYCWYAHGDVNCSPATMDGKSILPVILNKNSPKLLESTRKHLGVPS